MPRTGFRLSCSRARSGRLAPITSSVEARCAACRTKASFRPGYSLPPRNLWSRTVLTAMPLSRFLRYTSNPLGSDLPGPRHTSTSDRSDRYSGRSRGRYPPGPSTRPTRRKSCATPRAHARSQVHAQQVGETARGRLSRPAVRTTPQAEEAHLHTSRSVIDNTRDHGPGTRRWAVNTVQCERIIERLSRSGIEEFPAGLSAGYSVG